MALVSGAAIPVARTIQASTSLDRMLPPEVERSCLPARQAQGHTWRRWRWHWLVCNANSTSLNWHSVIAWISPTEYVRRHQPLVRRFGATLQVQPGRTACRGCVGLPANPEL